MKCKDLAAKLIKVQKDANDKFGAVRIVLKIVEPRSTWFGDFEPMDVKHNPAKHAIEIICEGKTTNFLESGKGFLKQQSE